MSASVIKEFQKIKHKYQLTTPSDLIEQADINILRQPLDSNTGGFTVTNNRCSTIVINSLWAEPLSELCDSPRVLSYQAAWLGLHSIFQEEWGRKIYRS